MLDQIQRAKGAKVVQRLQDGVVFGRGLSIRPNGYESLRSLPAAGVFRFHYANSRSARRALIHASISASENAMARGPILLFNGPPGVGKHGLQSNKLGH